ncbi:MAG: hypothetical protein AB9888_12360 [Bacteroidales bacterium]
MEKVFEKMPDRILSDSFLELCDKKKYLPAKETIIDICKRLIDKDGNFLEQFQTGGFEQRLWEIMLFAIFETEGFQINQDRPAPDFSLSKGGKTVFVEATTSNASNGDKTSEELIAVIKSKVTEETRIEAFNKLKDLYIEKIGSALSSKLSKNYQELEWVKGNPLLLAIAPLHDEFARQNSDSLLITYLYGYEFSGVEDNHGNLLKVDYIEKSIFEKRNKTKITAFFNTDSAKCISAVIFFNDLTTAKFNRMGFINGIQEDIIIVRSCDIYDPDSSRPKVIYYVLGTGEPKEEWKQGVSIFHNPNALFPLDTNLFNGFRQVWFKDGKLDGFMPKFFPFNSLTLSDTLSR